MSAIPDKYLDLLQKPAFASLATLMPGVQYLRFLTEDVQRVAAIVRTDLLVQDPDRREELARLFLRSAGVVPAGETLEPVLGGQGERPRERSDDWGVQERERRVLRPAGRARRERSVARPLRRHHSDVVPHRAGLVAGRRHYVDRERDGHVHEDVALSRTRYSAGVIPVCRRNTFEK